MVAIHAGVDALGLVFYSGSPRAVEPKTAAQIVAGIPAMVSLVGLFVNADRATIEASCAEVPLDLLQFHGDETADFCASFGRPWMKAVRVAEDTNIESQILSYSGANAVLLDTYVHGVRGGTGARFDWSRVPSDTAVPVVLAGGLKPDNVGAAVMTARPFAVDVSGGVESAPGVKDAKLIREFMAAVNTADSPPVRR